MTKRRLASCLWGLSSLGLAACSSPAPGAGVETTARSSAAVTSKPAPATPTVSRLQATAWPDADCELRSPQGGQSLQVVADDVGVVHFSTVRDQANAKPGVNTVLSLECHDDTGRTGTFTVDMASPSALETATAAIAPDTMRPALAGDPMQYSQEELWANGYGHRPDPVAVPKMYEAWQKAVSVPAHRANPNKVHSMRGRQPTVTSGESNWSGGILLDSNPPSVGYDLAIYRFNVPSPQTSSPSCQNAGFWGGLGGTGLGSLIQTGIIITYVNVPGWGAFGSATPFYQFPTLPATGLACYDNYCAFSFGASAGDEIYGDSWSCDANGTVNYNGAYGCFYLSDYSAGHYGQTQLAKKGTFAGESAEAVIENSSQEAEFCGSSGQFFDFGSMNIWMDAWRNDNTGEHNFGTDDAEQDDALDYSNGNIVDYAAVKDPSPDGTSFAWAQGS